MAQRGAGEANRRDDNTGDCGPPSPRLEKERAEACAAVAVGLYVGNVAGNRLEPSKRDQPSLTTRARQAATDSVIKIWKWNRNRKKKKDDEE